MTSIKGLVEPIEKGKTKFIFFSGKGGVGKSSMSCATALWLAKKSYKTLLVTTDPAPNLSDIFGQEIGHKITQIKGVENLFAIEINPDIASEEYRERIIAPMREILDEKNLGLIKEQLNSPCVEEVAAFDKFIDFMDDSNYDVVIFDTAPTGHTLRLLELPSGWKTTLEKSKSTCIGPSASLQNAKLKYEKAISYLRDTVKTTFIFVLRPENSSILEVKRSSKELEKLGIKTNLMIVNGVLPEEVCTDEFFKKKLKKEKEILYKMDSEFKGIQKVFYPLMDSEVSGIISLESIGRFLYESQEIVRVVNSDNSLEKFSLVNNNENIEEIYNLLTPVNGTRYVFFTGKGGVGKSTIACTTALSLAEKGFKTLVITTDPASHLHAIFGQEVEHEPKQIIGIENLYAARIDQKKALVEYKTRILNAVKDNDEETRKSVEEDLNSPCAEEMAAFEKFMSYFEQTIYDIIIFDTAPTGHTLRLLELPNDWSGFIELGSLTKKTSIETKDKFHKVIEKMRNKEKSTLVFVMYPEYTPIIEAWRASEDLKKQVGIETSLVAVNYLLPEDYGNNLFFINRRKQQEKYLSLIKDKFKTHLLIVPLLDHEPKNTRDLREFSYKIFGGENGR